MYRFKSKADGDVIMLAPAGDQLMRILGKEPAERGIISLAAIPPAIAALEQAIAVDDAARRSSTSARPPSHAANDRDDDGGDAAQGVGLRQRAWPLLEMMRRSLAEHADIVWGV